MGPRLAIVHDYLTQEGGAERVVLAIARAFPDAPIYTSVYEPSRTFPEFGALDVRPMRGLNALRPLRRHHRLGLPLYGPAFARLQVDADVVLCSSSGWAHGVSTDGRKIVYCYTPARWLYQPDAYLRTSRCFARASAAVLGPSLRRRDIAAAATAHAYLAISSVVRQRIAGLYGIAAEVLAPPPALSPHGDQSSLDLESGFVLVVSRLLAYKNVDVIIRACVITGRRLVVAGDGPDRGRLEALSGAAVTFLGRVSDAQLRWLYANCAALVAAAHEDFGLTPLEANSFGAPVAALRWGGYLDTVVEGSTGVFFDSPEPDTVARAIEEALGSRWDRHALAAHATGFGEVRFATRLRQIVGARESRPSEGPERSPGTMSA